MRRGKPALPPVGMFLVLNRYVRRASAIVTLALCLSTPAWASGLAVTSDSAYSGVYGLEVTVGSSCTSDNDLSVPGQTVTGTPPPFEGCNTVTAGTGFTVAGTGEATFTAGTKIILENGFSVASGGTFTAVIDSSLTPFAYVQDDSPESETSYNAIFYVNFEEVTIGSGDQIHHFVAYNSAGIPQLRVLIDDTGPSFALEVRNDSGSYLPTSWVTALATGWNKVEVAWAAGSGATPSITVNDGTPESVTANTTARRIDYVRWGAIGGTVTSGTSGYLQQDDFSSWR